MSLAQQTTFQTDVNLIRVDVSLVNVAFTVRDARGALVMNLGRDDFEILEDAVPQSISFFARSAEVPLSLGLAVDFSGSQDHFLKRHHRDLETFLKSVLGPRDHAFLLCFGNYLRLVSDFSPSPATLIDALSRYEKGKRDFPLVGPSEQRELGTGFYDAIYHAVNEKLDEPRARRFVSQDRHQGQTTRADRTFENRLLRPLTVQPRR